MCLLFVNNEIAFDKVKSFFFCDSAPHPHLPLKWEDRWKKIFRLFRYERIRVFRWNRTHAIWYNIKWDAWCTHASLNGSRLTPILFLSLYIYRYIVRKLCFIMSIFIGKYILQVWIAYQRQFSWTKMMRLHSNYEKSYENILVDHSADMLNFIQQKPNYNHLLHNKKRKKKWIL